MMRMKQYTMNLIILFVFLNIAVFLTYNSISLVKSFKNNDDMIKYRDKTTSLFNGLGNDEQLLTEAARIFVMSPENTTLDNYFNILKNNKTRNSLGNLSTDVNFNIIQSKTINNAFNKFNEIVNMQLRGIYVFLDAETLNKNQDLFKDIEPLIPGIKKTVMSETKENYAKKMLFGEQFQSLRKTFDIYINNLQKANEDLISQDLSDSNDKKSSFLVLNGIIAFVIISCVGFILLFIHFQLIRPIQKYAMILEKSSIKDNIYLEPMGSYELSRLVVLVNDYSKELIKATREAEKANRSKSDFIANMSHEIRTPLNAVIGFSEILTKTIKEEKHLGYLNSINAAGKTLLSLINDILDLSKIEAGMIQINNAPTSLRTIFNEVEIILGQKISSKNLEFFIEVDDKLPSGLLLDEIKTRQILLNMVGNALKFTDKGSIKLSVKVIDHEQEMHDGNIENGKINIKITIQDTGKGIMEDELEAVFGAFRQQVGQDVKKYGGTGLGLSISKKFVELMNGTIIVESKVNEGTAFIITLKDVEVNENILIEDDRIDIENIKLKKSRILIADDVESNKEVLTEMLNGIGMDVLVTSDGCELVEAAQKENPDLIITDIRMPNMDGIEATGKIKALPQIANIPVIAFTASSIFLDKSNFGKLGFSGYLSKPITFKDLITEISKFIPSEDIESSDVNGVSTKRTSNTAFMLDSLSSDAVQEITEKVTPLIISIKGPIRKTNVTRLAETLLEIGKKYNALDLENAGKTLMGLAEQYDVQNIIIYVDSIKKMLHIQQD